MTPLRAQVQELRELGFRATAFRAMWELKTRSGLASILDRRVRQREKQLTRVELPSLRHDRLRFGRPGAVINAVRPWIGEEQQALLLARARNAAEGRIVCFSHWEAGFGRPFDWHLNPVTGRRWQAGVHWSAALRNAERIGDVKLTWEAGRFPHAYVMGRAGAFHASQAAGLTSPLAGQLDSFERENPFGYGIHWYSSQEAVIRTVALMFAYHAFGRPECLEGFLIRALCRTGVRVGAYLDYAREAVYNNHLIWEALGLFLAGRLLDDPTEAAEWEVTGRTVLDKQAERQVYPDGGYIQQSHTYHRMAMQAYLVASSLLDRVPETWRAAMERSLDFLTAQQDPETGQLPNYGANDGALPCVLTTCDYRDFRPTLQALSLLARGVRQYPPGPWDEEAAWLLGPASLEAPERRPVFASHSFEYSGHHVIRGRSPDTFAVFRCGTLRDRFSQMDMLHLDVRWRGENVLADAGSYLYNGPAEWHNHFLRTGSHNTIQIDGQDQMVHHRRFKTLFWTKAKILRFENLDGWSICEGEHYGYQRLAGGPVHRRAVLFVKDGLWVVADTVLGEGVHSARLHWLGGDYPWEADAPAAHMRLKTPKGTFSVTVLDQDGNSCDGDVVAGQQGPPRGWLSHYYGEKIPAPSFVVSRKEQAPFTLVSVLCEGTPKVSAESGVWTVRIEDGAVQFRLGEGCYRDVSCHRGVCQELRG